MFQDDLWATAPRPRSMGCLLIHQPEREQYWLSFDLHYSKNVDGADVHFVRVTLDEEEKECASILYWVADRYFWKNRPVRHVEREVNKRLAKYRAEVDVTRIPVSGFHAVDFG